MRSWETSEGHERAHRSRSCSGGRGFHSFPRLLKSSPTKRYPSASEREREAEKHPKQTWKEESTKKLYSPFSSDTFMISERARGSKRAWCYYYNPCAHRRK